MRCGLTDPRQDALDERQPSSLGEPPRQVIGLVVPALPAAGGVERHGDNPVDALEKILLRKGGESPGEIERQMLLPRVLNMVKHRADRVVEIEQRIRPVEREINVGPALAGTKRPVCGAARAGIAVPVILDEGGFTLAAEPLFTPGPWLVAHDAESGEEVVNDSLQEILDCAHGLPLPRFFIDRSFYLAFFILHPLLHRYEEILLSFAENPLP